MSEFEKKLIKSKQTYLHIQPEAEPEEPKLQIEDVHSFTGACDYFEEAWKDFKLGGMQAPTLSGTADAAKTVGSSLYRPVKAIGNAAKNATGLYQKFNQGAANFAKAAKEDGALGAAAFELWGGKEKKKKDGESKDGAPAGNELGVDGSGLKDLFAKTLMLQPNAGGNSGVKLGNFTYVFDPPKLQGHVVQNWKVGGGNP